MKQLGYDPILFEKGDIPFHHDTLLEQSCLREVDSADMLVLVIGGRYGSLSKEDRELLERNPQEFFGRIRSVTQMEYEKARDKNIPVFAFVDSQVLAEYSTYKANKDVAGINYAFVDSVKIYELIDDIYSQRRNNYLKDFSKLEDITSWLRDQWSGLFSDLLKEKINVTRFKNLEEHLAEMGQLVATLKTYSEAILRSVNEPGSGEIISTQEKSIQRSRIARFRREALTDHLIKTMSVRIPATKMLELFVKAPDLETYLKDLGIEGGDIESFLSDFGTLARPDFTAMKGRYADERELLAEGNGDSE